MLTPSVVRQAVTGAAVAVALLTSISAITLAQPGLRGSVPGWLRESVVTGLWFAAVLVVLVAAVPRMRNGIGDSRPASFTTAGVLLIALMMNAISLGDELARFPQSFTSLLAAAVALGGTTLAALSFAPRDSS